MDRQAKQDFVAEVSDIFKKSGSVLVTHYQGLTVSDVTKLRTKLREVNANFKVIKNSLASIALDDSQSNDLKKYFSGPTAIAYSEDPVSASKGIVEFAKEHEKLKIIAGIVEGNIVDKQGIEALAKMPSINELRATIVTLLSSPARHVANNIQATATNLAGVFEAYANSGK